MDAFPWQTFVRALLKFGGGYFVKKGITDSSTMEIITAGLAAALGVAWGYIEKRYTQRKIQTLTDQIGPEI